MFVWFIRPNLCFFMAVNAGSKFTHPINHPVDRQSTEPILVAGTASDSKASVNAVWKRNRSPGPPPPAGPKKTMNIIELFFLKLLNQKIPGASTHHLKTLLVLLGKNQHFTLKELAHYTKLSIPQTEKVLSELARLGIVHQEGCLYRQQRLEQLEILA